MFIPMRIIVMLDHENDAVMINNSPIRLMDGGRARFRLGNVPGVAIVKGIVFCDDGSQIHKILHSGACCVMMKSLSH